MEYSSGFKNVESIGKRYTLSNLEDNIKSFLDWSFINIGGFINVEISTSGLDNTQYHQLNLVEDPSNTNHTVWEAAKKDWVYETGVDYIGSSPIEISGVYLNDNFLVAPTGYGNYTYSLDYKNGRVLFDNPVNKTSKVELEYSYRHIQTYKSSETRILEINQESLSLNRVEPPAILIEMIERTSQKPWELGNSKNIFYQDILLHILARNPTERTNISNILMLQKDKFIYLYDLSKIIEDGVYPIDYKGSINSSRLNYNLIFKNTNYIDKKAFIKDSNITEFNLIGNDIYHNIVRWTIEIFPD